MSTKIGAGRVKGEVHPTAGHEGPEGEKYTSTFLTLALHVGWWPTPRPGRFPLEKKTRYLLYRKRRGPQSPSGRGRKISQPRDFDPRTVQKVGTFALYPRIKIKPVEWAGYFARKEKPETDGEEDLALRRCFWEVILVLLNDAFQKNTLFRAGRNLLINWKEYRWNLW